MAAGFRILFNGDSNVAGSELASPSTQGMAARLSEKCLATHVINLASDGASNDLIYDSTIKFLENNNNLRPQLVVIGWTEAHRVQWYLRDQWNHYRLWEINHLGVGIPVPEEYQKRYQHWVEHVQRDGMWQVALSSYWHNKIYNLHCMLKEKEIAHIFFNAFSGFKIQSQADYSLPWGGAFYHPYDDANSYIGYCQSQNYQEITPGWLHFPAQAHEEWAEKLFMHMKTNHYYDALFKRG